MASMSPDPEDEVLSDAGLDETSTSPISKGEVETLVAGRSRRSNAGNKLAQLLNQEADADDTLFLSDPSDDEFVAKDKDHADDYLVDSSSDEDDAGPPKEGEDEDMEGERELQKQVRDDKRAQKRKATDAFLKPRKPATAPAKRVTIREETTAVETPTGADAAYGATASGRPRKRSERVSWVPTFEASRVSSRTLSLQNRSQTLKRLEENEKRRQKTLQLMERAAKKKEKTHPKKVLTQEERLAEAKITEAKNLKSLNRWEEQENARVEEQRQRLAALQNRKLIGPVVSIWSGRAEWDDHGKLLRIGRGMVEEIDEEKEKEKELDKAKRKKSWKNSEREKEEAQRQDTTPTSPSTSALPQQTTMHLGQPSPHTITDSASPSAAPAATSQAQPASSEPRTFPLFLNGILDYAAHSSPAVSEPEISPTTSAHTLSLPQAPTPNTGASPALPDQSAPVPEPKVEYSARNLVILENFEPDEIRNKEGMARVLFDREQKRMQPVRSGRCFLRKIAHSHPHKCLVDHGETKIAETRERALLPSFSIATPNLFRNEKANMCTATPPLRCVITNQINPQFRDPVSGMPYASLAAYKELKRILRGEVRWSTLLGAYAGDPKVKAAGVPIGF